MANRIEGATYFSTLLCGAITLPAGSVDKTTVATSAGIEQTKLEHQHRIGYHQAKSDATADNRIVYTCYGTTGSVLAVEAGTQVVCGGDSTITIAVNRKRGAASVAVLSASIVLDSNNVVYTPEAGTIDTANDDLLEHDCLEVAVTVSPGSGTLGDGLFVSITVAEDAA